MVNICLSGGARGADALWGATAALQGHSVVHLTFDGHNHSVDQSTIFVVSESDLTKANCALQRANETLQRKWPVSNPYVRKLLQRNFYQIRESDAVYAVASIGRNGVNGGTGWAVRMWLDRFTPEKTLPCFVYDQEVRCWTQWDGGGFLEISQPPPPSGTWTGIGTRDLNPYGTAAIENIFRI